MTQAFPDVSNHNGAMELLAGTVACLAKATEGTGYRDPYYAHYKSEAARVGALFGAYHFLREGNGAAQARFAYSVIGPGVPTMLDFEPEYDDAGNPISQPSMADAVAFRDTFRGLGGLIRLNYLPRWYWAGHLASPPLVSLADLGLVSSDYEAYSDTGPGWEPYGGLTPQVWQYTDRQPYSGQAVDFNAYRGTLDQLRALLGLASPEEDVALTVADGDLVADRTENRSLGTIVSPDTTPPAKTTLGRETASNPARWAWLVSAISALTTAVNKVATNQATELTDLGSITAEVGQIQVPQISQDALNAAVAAALKDPATVRGIAHALAVELHNDTPAS